MNVCSCVWRNGSRLEEFLCFQNWTSRHVQSLHMCQFKWLTFTWLNENMLLLRSALSLTARVGGRHRHKGKLHCDAASHNQRAAVNLEPPMLSLYMAGSFCYCVELFSNTDENESMCSQANAIFRHWHPAIPCCPVLVVFLHFSFYRLAITNKQCSGLGSSCVYFFFFFIIWVELFFHFHLLAVAESSSEINGI